MNYDTWKGTDPALEWLKEDSQAEEEREEREYQAWYTQNEDPTAGLSPEMMAFIDSVSVTA